jgi:hypothetical protein
MKHDSSRQIFEKYSNVMKIGLVVAEMFDAQGQTWQTLIPVITALLLRPMIAEGGKVKGQSRDAPWLGFPFRCWRGWGEFSERNCSTVPHFTTDFSICCSLLILLMNEIPLIIQKRLVIVWIHDNGGSG